MKAHIVGSGFGGLAAAAFLIRDANSHGPDITIYEASDTLGGGFFLYGDAAGGYSLPGSVFDAHFRCAFSLLQGIPSLITPGISVKKEFCDFNANHPFQDRGRIVDGAAQVVPHQPGFGLGLSDAWNFLELAFSPESTLDGRRIDEFFSKDFFCTEFWLLWSTVMGSLPEQSAIEFRRYLLRTLGLFPDLYDMTGILRTPHAQHQALIDPLVAWLDKKHVEFVTNATVKAIGLAQSPGSITVSGIEYVLDGATQSVEIAPEDILLVTTGSQIANSSTGTPTTPAPPMPLGGGSSVALWRQLATLGPDFGDPDVFFDQKGSDDWRWVSFTVTTTANDFLTLMTALTSNPTGTGGVVTLRDSPWLISLTIFEQPEVTTQPAGVYVWWGYGLHPERNGHYVKKPMADCTGNEILEEVVKQLKFDAKLQTILATSKCIPCVMPYVNNIWAPRSSGDRPQVVPNGATNLGLIGQYVEVPQDIAFTMEYSARTAWEAVHLLRNGPAPPPVYQATSDPLALLAALRALLGI
jgi:oleate hydratase